MSSARPSALERCAALPWKACLALLGDLIRDAPDACAAPALALRDKARSGELPADAIPVLTFCLVDAPNPETLAQLAKTLAVFGRASAMAAPYLVARVRDLAVTDDESFWALDGALSALGFLGGAEEAKAVRAWQRSKPETRAGKLYQGRLSAADRQGLFRDTVERVLAMMSGPDPGGWTGRRTTMTVAQSQAKGKLSPWMTRGG